MACKVSSLSHPKNGAILKIQYITTNSVLKIRKERLDGKEYWVAPVSMLVPGVLNGSKGPLFYPKSEVTSNFQAWNYMPITLGHPYDDNGSPTSARSPEIIEKFGLGFIFNATIKRGKLDGEAWFDYDKTSKLEPRIIENMRDNVPTELSTGLFTDNYRVQNKSFKGKSYSAVARNYKPDHLAILVDSRGACSLQDGCGILVNEGEELVTNIIKKLSNGKYRLLSHSGKNLGTFDSLAAAKKHEGEVQMFKHKADNECGCEDPSKCDCDECKKRVKETVGNSCEYGTHKCKFAANANTCKFATNAKTCEFAANAKGVWRTIRGAKVFIQDGKITKGPKSLMSGTGHAKSVKKQLESDISKFEGAKKKSKSDVRKERLAELKEEFGDHSFAREAKIQFETKIEDFTDEQFEAFKEYTDASMEGDYEKEQEALHKIIGSDTKDGGSDSGDDLLGMAKKFDAVPKDTRGGESELPGFKKFVAEAKKYGVEIEDAESYKQVAERIIAAKSSKVKTEKLIKSTTFTEVTDSRDNKKEQRRFMVYPKGMSLEQAKKERLTTEVAFEPEDLIGWGSAGSEGSPKLSDEYIEYLSKSDGSEDKKEPFGLPVPGTGHAKSTKKQLKSDISKFESAKKKKK